MNGLFVSGVVMRRNGPVISLDKVMVHYGNGIPVLKNVSLELRKKSFYFLTGASGAGKSTLIRLLYMGLKPASGNLKIFGENVAELSPNEICDFRQRNSGLRMLWFGWLPPSEDCAAR